MNDNLTPWYPPHIKPVRVGVYETGHNGVYQHWNGTWWGRCSALPEYCVRDFPSDLQIRRWRGLKSPA